MTSSDKMEELNDFIKKNEITDELINNLNIKIKKAIQYMSLINSGYFLIFIVLNKFKIVIKEIETQSNTISCIRADLKKLKVETSEKFYDEFSEMNLLEDKIIYLDSRVFTFPKITIRDIIIILSHEIMHLLYKHFTRLENRDIYIWNLAADHVINRELIKNSDILRHDLTFSIFYDKELNILMPDCSTEEAYEYFIKNVNNKNNNNNNNETSDTNQKNKKYEIDISDNGIMNIKDTIQDKEFNIQVSSIENYNNIDYEKNEVNEIINNLHNEMKINYKSISENFKGNIAGSFKSIFSYFFDQPVPWENILNKSIKTNIQIVPDNRSWVTPNKKYISHNLILPSIINTEEYNAIGILIIIIDTSGSISNTDLQKFSSVISQSFKHFEEIILIFHDQKIQDIQTYNNHEEEIFIKYIKTSGYRGRGGTSHGSSFKYIDDEIWADKDKRDKLSMIISLTDGYSDISYYLYKKKWFINNVPITFLITEDGNLILDTETYKHINIINMKENNKKI
jgi:predicted metal-dependent peptidase